MPPEQAEALAEGAYRDTRLATLRTELVTWMLGTVGLATLVNHWWK